MLVKFRPWPKTKNVASFLKTLGLENSRVLFLKETAGLEDKEKMQDKYKNFAKSLKNLKKVHITGVDNVNAYDLAVAKDVIVLDSALEQLKTFLKGGK